MASSTLLGRVKYDELNTRSKMTSLEDNIELINGFVRIRDVDIMRRALSFNDFACLQTRNAKYKNLDVYSGAYLMTKWMILAIYLTIHKYTTFGSNLDYEILLLVCYRGMTDVMAYLDTDAIYIAVRKQLHNLSAESNIISSSHIVQTLKNARANVAQYEVVNYFAALLRNESNVARQEVATAEMPDLQLMRTTYLEQSLQIRAYAEIWYFISYYVLGERLSGQSNWVAERLQTNVGSSTRIAPWIWSMLRVERGNDEVLFWASGDRFKTLPSWYNIITQTRKKSTTRHASTSGTLVHQTFEKEVENGKIAFNNLPKPLLSPPQPPAPLNISPAETVPASTLEEAVLTPTTPSSRHTSSFIKTPHMPSKKQKSVLQQQLPSSPTMRSTRATVTIGEASSFAQSPIASSSGAHSPEWNVIDVNGDLFTIHSGKGDGTSPQRGGNTTFTPVPITIVKTPFSPAPTNSPAKNSPQNVNQPKRQSPRRQSVRFTTETTPISNTGSPKNQSTFKGSQSPKSTWIQPTDSPINFSNLPKQPSAPAPITNSPSPFTPPPSSTLKKILVVGLSSALAVGAAQYARQYFSTPPQTNAVNAIPQT